MREVHSRLQCEYTAITSIVPGRTAVGRGQEHKLDISHQQCHEAAIRIQGPAICTPDTPEKEQEHHVLALHANAELQKRTNGLCSS